MKQNKKPKQTLESAQYGLEINFNCFVFPIFRQARPDERPDCNVFSQLQTFPEEVRPCLTKYWKYKAVNPNRTVSISVFCLLKPLNLLDQNLPGFSTFDLSVGSF